MLQQSLTHLFLLCISLVVPTSAANDCFLRQMIELSKGTLDEMASKHRQLAVFPLLLEFVSYSSAFGAVPRGRRLLSTE